MSARIKLAILYLGAAISSTVFAAEAARTIPSSLASDAVAKELGWVSTPANNCGGYYLETPFIYSLKPENEKAVGVTSEGGFLSQRDTSLLEGNVTITRAEQQITANRAYLYRDPITGKLNVIDMIGDVHLRESNSLVIAKKGRYNFQTTSKSLIDIIYRTSLDPKHTMNQKAVQTVNSSVNKTANLTAWGKAAEFSQIEPRVYELSQASYSTCPPVDPTWSVKASHIVLNKNTGRGYATHARLFLKSIPVFYFPYLNFSIDKQRKTGFLWPTAGSSNKWGPYFFAPYYWNMAPNYDMTITPAILTKRGFQLNDEFRYLTHTSYGNIKFSILPNDKAFEAYQEGSAINPLYTNPQNTGLQSADVTAAELNRLLNSSPTRKSLRWRDDSRYNEHWSSHIDYNQVSDDYYLRDFGQTVNEISENQLLQEGDLYYKGKNWNFIGRLQLYQTLHPIDAAPVLNQYRRFPQLILNGDYPDQKYGLEYFITSEATHFDIRKTPGTQEDLPIGNRLNVQPGISLPLSWPYFYFNPRLQAALTTYNLYQTRDTDTPANINRAIPIFDIVSGFALNRDIHFLNYDFLQTLEPQFYYVFIPYRKQSSIPAFDTTLNTLTYEQIFNYNRFTGIDRIGDANQLGLGITSRLIDQESGLEKVRLGIGTIVYFAKRRVTLCNTPACVDNPFNPYNDQSLSPISAVLSYHINPSWIFNVNSIWNPISKQLDNATAGFQYFPDTSHLINIGYTYARSGDILSGVQTTKSINNLKVTDISAAWPIMSDISFVGRWSQNWNREHLQNLVYGLQYESCCWAVRIVGGRAFAGFDTLHNNKPLYTSEFSIQFSLKGLGDIGTGNPAGLLKGIPGYQTQFGQEL